jgi:hypothetical protein
MGIGIVTGGLGGVAVCILKTLHIIWKKKNCLMCFMKSLTVLHSDVIQFWSAVLPLDVAKTIIQTSPDKSSTRNPFLILNSVRCPVPFSFCWFYKDSLLLMPGGCPVNYKILLYKEKGGRN